MKKHNARKKKVQARKNNQSKNNSMFPSFMLKSQPQTIFMPLGNTGAVMQIPVDGIFDSKIDLPKGLMVLDKDNVMINGVEFTPEEVAVYDFLNGAKFMGQKNTPRYKECLNWFINNNIDLYNKVISRQFA